ncbi:low molecular weight phosphatase family protein [Microbacterium sp. SYP-A9085]|uniref:arsenate reductase/protein-tyrosine-phosphatase family protein n=1 Tax=Microbacterium sp. SYP-A9085 TaxID=2664454 RepID=UPI0034644949
MLTVCTGNICRSPLAALVLQQHLGPFGARVSSAGTRGLASASMTPEAQTLAAAMGVAADESSAHRSRFLTEPMIAPADLVLTMTREHRREVAELAPARLAAVFTVREFARLAADVPDVEILTAADAAGPDAAARVRAATRAVASRRGLVLPPADPSDDDVIDPYRRPWAVYQQSASQLAPALNRVIRTVRAALEGAPSS